MRDKFSEKVRLALCSQTRRDNIENENNNNAKKAIHGDRISRRIRKRSRVFGSHRKTDGTLIKPSGRRLKHVSSDEWKCYAVSRFLLPNIIPYYTLYYLKLFSKPPAGGSRHVTDSSKISTVTFSDSERLTKSIVSSKNDARRVSGRVFFFTDVLRGEKNETFKNGRTVHFDLHYADENEIRIFTDSRCKA